MPCDYSKYPPDWKQIRKRVLNRAGHECEFCGVQNYSVNPATGSRVILTIAHLDHDPENWQVKDERLRALCQRCHLGYDRKHRQEQRKLNKCLN